MGGGEDVRDPLLLHHASPDELLGDQPSARGREEEGAVVVSGEPARGEWYPPRLRGGLAQQREPQRRGKRVEEMEAQRRAVCHGRAVCRIRSSGRGSCDPEEFLMCSLAPGHLATKSDIATIGTESTVMIDIKQTYISHSSP